MIRYISFLLFIGFAWGENPTLESALQELHDAKVSKIVAIPLFPQYATSTTKSTIEKINLLAKKWHQLPKINYVEQFYNNIRFPIL